MKEKILFDSNVLIAGIVKFHPYFNRANPWMKKVIKREIELVICSHSLAEVYTVLSQYPVKPKFSPGTINRIIQEDIIKYSRIIALSPSDYISIIKRMSENGLTGGIIYDALIAKAAEKGKIDKLLTFNSAHFKKVWPDGKDIIIEP